MASGRGILAGGLVGLAIGVVLGNTMSRGYVARQVRTTGRTIMRQARGKVGQHINSWID